MTGAPADFGIGVSKVTDGRGADTAFAYQAVSGETHGLNYTESPFGAVTTGTGTEAVAQVVVSTMERDDGRGDTREFRYGYKGAPRRSTAGRGYAGFHETRVEDVEAETRGYAQVRMDWPHRGRVAATLTLDDVHGSHARTYERSENAYGALGMHAGSVKYPYLARATRWIYEANTAVGGSETVNTLVQSGEFVTRRTSTHTAGDSVSSPTFTAAVWGDVPDRAIGSVKQTVTTVENYQNTDTATEWTVGKTTGRTVTHAATGETSKTVDTTYTYRAGSRIVDTATRLPNHATLTLATDRTFDVDGHATGETVSGDGITSRTTTYGAYTEDRYPSSVTNALGQTTGFVYDLRFGKPKQVTDPDSDVSSTEYDAFGRTARETAPDGTVTATTYERCDVATCPDVADAEEAVKITVTHTHGSTQTAPTRVAYLDVLGREIMTETQALDAAKGWRRQFRQYDPLGRPKHDSPPYFSTETAPSCSVSNMCTSYTYDAFFTQHIVTRAGGGTVQTDRGGAAGTTTVDVTEQTFSPSATRKKRTKFDALGRIVETVDGYDGTDAVTTTYGYDAQGSLDQVAVDGVSVAVMAYDELGHRTNLTDASLGAWSFGYDTLSRLTLRTDAKSQQTQYAYDALDRPTQRRDCHAGCTPLVTNTWTWDAANATGQLSSRTNGALTQTYTYRAADGNPTNVATSVNVAGVLTASYTRALGYDAQSRLGTVNHNDAVTYTYGYGYGGHRTEIRHGTTVLQSFDGTDAFGSSTAESFNGGAFATARTFDGPTGRLLTVHTGVSATPKGVQDLEYKWREDGALYQRIDHRGTAAISDDLADTFTMDALWRVTRQATTGGAARALDFSYDDHGNLETKTSSATGDLDATAYTYGTTGKPHRLTRVTLDGVVNTLSYDANGNVTGYDAATGDDTAIVYDGRNRVTSITVGTSTPKDEFWHGPDGSRFLRRETWTGDGTSKSKPTVYVGAYEEMRRSDATVKRIRASGNVVRVRLEPTSGTATERFEYVHRDHLGSVDRVTDGAGAAASTLSSASFDPFGGRRAADWSGDEASATSANVLALQDERFARGFTDHEGLHRTGFVHMNGRVYDPPHRALPATRSGGGGARPRPGVQPLRLRRERAPVGNRSQRVDARGRLCRAHRRDRGLRGALRVDHDRPVELRRRHRNPGRRTRVGGLGAAHPAEENAPRVGPARSAHHPRTADLREDVPRRANTQEVGHRETQGRWLPLDGPPRGRQRAEAAPLRARHRGQRRRRASAHGGRIAYAGQDGRNVHIQQPGRAAGGERPDPRAGSRHAHLAGCRRTPLHGEAVRGDAMRPVSVLGAGLALAAVAGCAAGAADVVDDELHGLIEKMEEGQKTHDRKLRDWSIDFMSLARMFPDGNLRALARAAGRGRVGRIDELVAAGADVNARGRSDGTALWWALRKRNLKGFERLLEHGADPNQLIAGPHYSTTTVMHEAAQERIAAYLAAALKHGGDPNVRNGDSDTPLFKANRLTRIGETTALRMLLDSGAEVDAENRYGTTVAQLRTNRPDLLHELFVRGAAYDRRWPNGKTLLGDLARDCSLADAGLKPYCDKVRAWLHARDVEVPDHEP